MYSYHLLSKIRLTRDEPIWNLKGHKNSLNETSRKKETHVMHKITSAKTVNIRLKTVDQRNAIPTDHQKIMNLVELLEIMKSTGRSLVNGGLVSSLTAWSKVSLLLVLVDVSGKSGPPVVLLKHET